MERALPRRPSRAPGLDPSHSGAPWIIDLPITPDTGGLWTNKRWPEHVAPLDEVTWVADDAIRYLAPEVTLLIKAKLDRPKDLADLEATWPVLAPDRRIWLRDCLTRLHPGHRWLARLRPTRDTRMGGRRTLGRP